MKTKLLTLGTWVWLLLVCGATQPVAAAETAPVADQDPIRVRITPLLETGWADDRGRYIVDVLQQDLTHLAVRLETAQEQPIPGAKPKFFMEGGSQLLKPKEVSNRDTTDEYGVIEFAVVGGTMGMDQVRVEFGDAITEIFVNVISKEALGFEAPPTVEGGLPWDQLMSASIRYEEKFIVAEFPEAINKQAGKTVKLSGFMMPLDPEQSQKRFLLTSNPPSCFFHMPGGPAGAVEVFSEDGIEVTWDAVVLEGRFEPQHTSDVGVVYRLHEARLAKP